MGEPVGAEGDFAAAGFYSVRLVTLNGSPDTPGGRLLAATEEMAAVERGERAPAVEWVYDGPVLVEVRERGELVRRYRRPPEGSDLR